MKSTRGILVELLKNVCGLDSLRIEQVAHIQIEEAAVAIEQRIEREKRVAVEDFRLTNNARLAKPYHITEFQVRSYLLSLKPVGSEDKE